MDFGQKLLIGVTIIVIFVIVFTCGNNNSFSNTRNANGRVEPFQSYQRDIDATDDIKKYLFDLAPCHPSCCGDTFPPSWDNLTAPEIEQTLREQQEGTSNYVRTAYSCALGPRGQGCPCITKDAYRFLAGRGNNDTSLGTYIDPTYILKRVNIPHDAIYLSEREQVEIGETSQSETPRLNDISLERNYMDLSTVQPFNFSSKETQVMASQQY